MADKAASESYEAIKASVDEGIGRLTLDRPSVLNALTPAMMGEIADCMNRFDRDEEVRAVLIDAAGKGFSAGGDAAFLEELTGYDPFQIRETVYTYFAGAIKAIKLCTKPTVAAVNGVAIGAGFEIALACDFRIASQRALFHQSWIELGLISPLGGMFLLPRLVGLAKANEILLLGAKIDGSEALRIGLVNDTVAPEELAPASLGLARRLAEGAPLALRAMKEGIRRGLESSLAAEWEHNIYVQSMLLGSNDYSEGVAAMKARRKAVFRGK